MIDAAAGLIDGPFPAAHDANEEILDGELRRSNPSHTARPCLLSVRANEPERERQLSEARLGEFDLRTIVEEETEERHEVLLSLEVLAA